MGEPVAPEKLDAKDGKPDVPEHDELGVPGHDELGVPPQDEPGVPPQDELAILRRLLVGQEQDELVEIKTRLERDQLRVESLSEMLPSAVELRTTADDKLGDALAPTIGDSLQKSIKNNPQPIVDAITPIMGPAIRNAISRAIRSMTESLNTAIEHSFSAQGLKWRLEAARSGKPFGEIVLLHSLIYRIEQIFLIHRETGLPLQHVAADETMVKDADMVSGMLSAIQDFVHDSFGSASEKAPLETIEVGERTVWLEQGQQAILAAVIFGHAPTELRDVLQGALEEIHAKYGDEMAVFDGNVAEFESSRSQLESCLLVQYREKQSEDNASKKGAIVLGILGIALAAAISVWAYVSIRNQRTWTAYLERLQAEPGVIVTKEGYGDGKYVVSGLRDPLAKRPQAADHIEVVEQWKPYQSPEFAAQRFVQLFEPPETVAIELADGTLTIRGSAESGWITRVREQAALLNGISQVKLDAVVDERQGWSQYVERLRAEPGIVVVQTDRRDGKNFVLGMRDPLAADPVAILHAQDLDPDTIVGQWKPYQSLEPELVLKRVTQLVEPPAEIQLALRDGVLLINGVASHKWIVEAKSALQNVTGVHRVDTVDLVDQDVRQLASAISELEKQQVHAVAGGAELVAGQEDKVQLVATQMLAILRLAGEMNQQARFTVAGHAVPGKTAEVVQQVSQDRANALVGMLIARGVPADRLTAVGAGGDEFADGNDPTRARRVAFTVNLTER